MVQRGAVSVRRHRSCLGHMGRARGGGRHKGQNRGVVNAD